ncbi:MAG: hypothetical protein AAGB05_16575 [Pseudomonadota bacterium]
MIEILGETYEEVSHQDGVLWRGDLLLFDDASGADCKAYMVYLPEDRSGFQLVNYVGYKAGARLATIIPDEASQPGALNIRLSWLREYWSETIPFGTFETTTFLSWSGAASD